jgi:hypothetical protein
MESVVSAKTLWEVVRDDIVSLNKGQISVMEIACMVHDDRLLGWAGMEQAQGLEEWQQCADMWFGATVVLWSYRWKQ